MGGSGWDRQAGGMTSVEAIEMAHMVDKSDAELKKVNGISKPAVLSKGDVSDLESLIARVTECAVNVQKAQDAMRDAKWKLDSMLHRLQNPQVQQ